MNIETFNAFLARLHYLSHPYLSILSASIVILIGSLVLLKNIKSEVNRAFFLFTFTISFWFIFGNALPMLYYRKFGTAVLWYKFGYMAVPFIPVSYYNFYLANFKKNKRILYFLCCISIVEIIVSWIWKDLGSGLYILPNVGLCWNQLSFYCYFLLIGMVKYVVVCLATAFAFMAEYKKQTSILRKKQIQFLTIMSFALTMGWAEWLPSFNIPLRLTWPLMPVGIVLFSYVIVHYRAMEIDTVIHRTILWLITIFLLIFPASIINLILSRLIYPANPLISLAVISIYLIFFVAYYTRLRPRIDHFFRRRKYDYQTILGKLVEKLATTININDLTRQLLVEVSETMYLRNSELFISSKGASGYSLAGRRGYQETGGLRQRTSLEVYTDEEGANLPENRRKLDCDNPICKWMIEHQDILEREQVEANPLYQDMKQDALQWFSDREIELLVPLILENKVNALLGLGKKENLQSYTGKDIELLKKLGQEAGVSVFNALHYKDLAEKERLDEEMKMGRQIQMALLPRVIPQVPDITVQGLMQPAKEIGGDYYDFIGLPEKDQLAIVIGDVSGKGVAAGLLMSMVKATINSLSQERIPPRQILLRTNQFIYQHIGGQKFMTLLYLIWKSSEKKLTYSSAGHEHILIYRNKAQQVEAIQSGGFMLGMIPDIDTFLEEKQIILEPGDKILLYTDGVTEAQNEAGDRFGLVRLKETFNKYNHKSASELMEAIKDEVFAFAGSSPQYDDITLVVMEAK